MQSLTQLSQCWDPTRTTTATALTTSELTLLLQALPNWRWLQQSEWQLQRQFQFDDFAEAWRFCDEIAALAELHQHHPQLILSWGQLTVTWWTHRLASVQMNDVALAATTELLYQQR
ncbi:MAG: 4a-hydroxytetrahydrobiopterin dehydratase [Ferrimonas sp.]